MVGLDNFKFIMWNPFAALVACYLCCAIRYWAYYHDNHAEPDKELRKVLEESDDALDMYLHHLPDQLSYTEEEHR